MLDHASLGVADLEIAVAFYDAVLGPLGYTRVWLTKDAAGYGPPGAEDRLALKLRTGEARLAAGPGSHLALTAPSEVAVAAFHAAAVNTGGTSDGPPGPRPDYGVGYYAAFVRDPDGHALEAVHHGDGVP